MRVRHMTVLAFLCVAAALTAGCDRAPERPALKPGTPEAAVQGMLDLRAENSTSVAGYTTYVATPVAEVLVADAEQRAPGESPTPGWETPRRTKSGTSTAEVTVRWQRSVDHTGWPATTVFLLSKTGNRWMLIDAIDSTASVDATKTP